MKKEILDSKMLKISIPIVILLFIIFILTQKVYVININNQEIGFVKNTKSVASYQETIATELSKTYGADVSAVYPITFTKISKSKVNISTESEILESLKSKQTFNIKGFQLIIDNSIYASTISSGILDTLLANVKTQFMNDYANIDIVEFIEDVKIVEASFNVKTISSKSDIAKLQDILLNGLETEEKYIVQKGDVMGNIAKKHGMTLTDIELANPDINIHKIKIGQAINISAPTKILHVKNVTTK